MEIGPLEDLEAEGSGLDLELLQEPVLHLLLQPLEQDGARPRLEAGLGEGQRRPQGQPREHGMERKPALVHVEAAVEEGPHDPDHRGRQQAGRELQGQRGNGPAGVGADHPAQEAEEGPRRGRALEDRVGRYRYHDACSSHMPAYTP